MPSHVPAFTVAELTAWGQAVRADLERLFPGLPIGDVVLEWHTAAVPGAKLIVSGPLASSPLPMPIVRGQTP